MTVIKTTPLSELGSGTVQITDDYYVDLPDTDHLIVVMTAEYPYPVTRFEHHAVMAAYSTTAECKHYNDHTGRKWWTQHAIREFYFAIPTTRIAMRHEKGYSYVPVLIGGEPFLRDDLVELAMVVTQRCNGPALQLSPNGIATVSERWLQHDQTDH